MSFDKKAALEARRPEYYYKRVNKLVQELKDCKYVSEYLKNIQDPDLTSKIAVQIPAFCDPDLIMTIKSALAHAANPWRIHFCICLQDDDQEKIDYIKSLPRCKCVVIKSEESPGTCAARNICQNLITDESFSLHLDGHMRFADCWDVALIACWQENNISRSVISSYALSVDHDKILLSAEDNYWTTNAKINEVCTGYIMGFSDTAMSFYGSGVRNDVLDRRNVEHAFVSGHLLFGPSDFDREVPMDPDCYHISDEVSYSARLWTHGWRIFAPHVRCIYHVYMRTDIYPDLKRFAQNIAVSSTGCSKKVSERVRNQILFGVINEPEYLGIYGPGKDHSIWEYMNFAGLDYKNKKFRVFAHKGDYTSYHTTEDLAVYTESKK